MNQSQDAKSKFWLDKAVEEIIALHPGGEINVSSGHSPSGNYHVGLVREMATSRALVWALRQRGRDAKHIDFVDDFDVLRKIPVDIDPALSSELGKPLFLAKGPDPDKSYGDYYYQKLIDALTAAGIKPDETFFAHDTYLMERRYTEAIKLSLQKLDEARSIIEEVSHRRLPADWAPVQILSDNDSLKEWTYAGHDLDKQTIAYRTQDGREGEISFAEGRVKLDWRLDWPARWWMWNIHVEPFGRDHATKGGSYDTGKELVNRVFGGEAPVPVPYEFIMLAGQSKKMSKSAGGVITPADAIEIMPAEVLRYFAVRSRPEKQLVFDSGQGMYNLVDEFAAAEHAVHHNEPNPFKEAAVFAIEGGTENRKQQIISSVPFKHLVQVYQAARGDHDETLAILERTDYKKEVKDQREVILEELKFVKNWLDKYAPDEVKFEIQQQRPEVELSGAQTEFLKTLANSIESHDGEIDGQKMHELIYEAKDQIGLEPKEAFQALYRVILGKDYGPKAGWFLANLDREWLIERLKLEN